MPLKQFNDFSVEIYNYHSQIGVIPQGLLNRLKTEISNLPIPLVNY